MSSPLAARNGIARRAALISGANVVAFAISFFVPLVIVRVLSIRDFGLYKQAFQILSSAGLMLNLQVSASAVFFMAREPQKKQQVAANVFIFYFFVGALVFLTFSIFPEWV